jgi:transcriptional regulator with XRE-family HTH domain
VGNRVTESDRKLGKALAQARQEAGRTQAEVARAVNRNQTWVSRTESGSRRPTPNDTTMLLDLYRPADGLRASIEALRCPPPVGAPEGSRLDPNFMELKNLELAAVEICALISERLPISLQSEQYTLLQYRLAGHGTSEADLLAERRRRQRVFTRDSPAPCTVVVAESALYRMPGGRTNLVGEQASYLLELIDRHPQLSLHVLPFDADLAYLDADLVIFKFNGKPRFRGFVPFGTTAHELRGREVSERMTYWRAARDAALGPDQSRKFIHNLAQNGYRRPV